MYDSGVMVIFIICFIFAFSWMGQRLYMGTVEGAMHFKTLEDSLWSMLVCLTTSNFPDVMLPGYMAFRPYCLLFLVYMVMGLFLFMSLVLAIFYSNFKIRYENKINKDEKKRNEFLYTKYELYGGAKGHLVQAETFKMFLMLHSLASQTVIDIEAQAENTLGGHKEKGLTR
jgi:two pore calcium channel protein